MEGSRVDGGVLIVHQFNEGKHQYEVKSVFKPRMKEGEKFFFRRGDKLRLVNETELQDVPPEEFAEILSKDSPLLTVHKTMRKREPVVKPSGEHVMVPYLKEEKVLIFSQEMIREDLPEQDSLPSPEGDEDVCTEENGLSDFLLVSMKKTSISVITGRSCDPKEPCHECKAKCEYNDIVIVTESSTVTLVPRGGGSLLKIKTNEVVVEHRSSFMFINGMCSQKSVFVSQNPERISIYYYKSDRIKDSKGIPVVLNFTGSDCFLKCCKNGEKVQLQIEMCDKQQLKSISRSDQSNLAYVFYMKSDPSRNFTFESALHRCWFMKVSEDNKVQMEENTDAYDQPQFYFVIQKSQGA